VYFIHEAEYICIYKDITCNTEEREVVKDIISVFLKYENPSSEADGVTNPVNFKKFQNYVCSFWRSEQQGLDGIGTKGNGLYTRNLRK
jgi:hypothetical protein